jgi:hypothetical protein
MSEEVYRRVYNSFSGVDMTVLAENKLIAEIQGLSYTVTREKAPLYTMGSADPRSFSRGKRGIAGSMIFLVFDRSALLDSLKENARYMANTYELTREQLDATPQVLDTRTVFDVDAVSTGTIGTVVSDIPNPLITLGKSIAKVRYHDQIPPFNVVLTAGNEYGATARMVIQGVEIMNCGSGLSIDDITTDESCTFVATGIIPWHKQKAFNLRTGTEIPASGVGPAYTVDGSQV